MMSEIRSELKIIDVTKSDDALWDTFVSRSPQGTFFQNSAWINLIEPLYNIRSKRLFCLRNDQPVGGLQYYETRKLFWKVITPTPLVPFSAPLLYAANDEKLQKRVSNYLNISSAFAKYLNNNLDFWILDAPHTFSDARSFIWKGALVEPRYTYVVNLDDEKGISANFNQSTRKKLKLAEKENIIMIESEDPSELITLFSKSYHRHNRTPLIDEKILVKLLRALIILPNVKLYYVSIRNHIKSARLVVIDGQTVYDLLAGSDDDTGIASVYLISQLLLKYCQSNQYFDFMGADHPDIEQFKRGFGGELKQGFRISGKAKFPLSMLIKLNEYRLNKKRDI